MTSNAVLAAVVAEQLPGYPLWLLVVNSRLGEPGATGVDWWRMTAERGA